jgi:hypothetical protein
MRRLPLFLLGLLSIAPATLHAQALSGESTAKTPGSAPIRFAIGVSGGLGAIGVYGEMVFHDLWAVQLQRYHYSEITWEKNPAELFELTAAEFGAYARGAHAKFGVLTGLALIDGTLRGKALPPDEPSGLCAFSCRQTDEHEALRGKRLALPIKFVLGGHWTNLGLNVSPQIYFADGINFANVLVNIELGVL